jgi:hypothetical protein
MPRLTRFSRRLASLSGSIKEAVPARAGLPVGPVWQDGGGRTLGVVYTMPLPEEGVGGRALGTAGGVGPIKVGSYPVCSMDR